MSSPPGNTARCAWATGELLTPYHDEEWGVPVHDDHRHYQFLVLEAAQAGLSWLTVLRRREGYRQAFCDFDPEKVARFGDRQIAKLLEDPGIIRNRAKVDSAITNARAILSMKESHGSFDAYLWDFVGGATVVNHHMEHGLRLALTPGLLAMGLGLAAALGTLGGLYPAWRASRLAPMETIRLGSR